MLDSAAGGASGAGAAARAEELGAGLAAAGADGVGVAWGSVVIAVLRRLGRGDTLAPGTVVAGDLVTLRQPTDTAADLAA